MSSDTRLSMPALEAELFAEGPVLGSILPGRDLLDGRRRRIPVDSLEALASLVRRCFVQDQFVALAHWNSKPRRTLDRAHVHRKIYPVVI